MSIVRGFKPRDPLPPTEWSEHKIAGALALQTFQRKAIVLVPNCNWTGYECDLMVVEQRLRVIDVEVKISRSDLKADAKKDKWWHRQFVGYGPVEEVHDENGRLKWRRQDPIYNSTARQWPPKIWKHYYAVPAEIWDDSLLEFLPSPASGVIALVDRGRPTLDACVIRRATPCRDATVLTPAQAINVARLANLRYWDARQNADRLQRELVAARSEGG